MSYIGGGPYYAETCPECGALLWTGDAKILTVNTIGTPKRTMMMKMTPSNGVTKMKRRTNLC